MKRQVESFYERVSAWCSLCLEYTAAKAVPISTFAVYQSLS
jgi:hypothetical protein